MNLSLGGYLQFHKSKPRYRQTVQTTTYVKNGGKVVEATLSKTQLQRLTFSGQLEKLKGMHGTTGKISTEYKFIGKELKQAVMSLMK